MISLFAVLGRGSPSGRGRRCAIVLLMAGAATWSCAFPPAPHYTIFGNVRDEFGTLLPDAGGNVIFSLGDREVARNPIAAVSVGDFNYQIRLRLDMARAGTASYSSLAANTGNAFTLAVEIGGVRYLPIEVSSSRAVGNPADRHRLDLTLGVDSDNDGLPDAWEQQRLFHAGLPIEDLWRVNPDESMANDGIANIVQYVAMTYANDSRETFYLKIVEFTRTRATFEFFTLTNQSYHLEKSTDLENWTPVEFTVGDDSAPVSSHTATSVGVKTAFVDVLPGETRVFYRLGVQ